jgi:ABC-type transport system involved in cytochrome c biogenesis permease subunit
MNRPNDDNQNGFKSAVTITVIGVAVITFVILFIAIFGGLWLDRLLNTRPIITIVLVIISIPVTLVLMLRLVKAATSRIKPTQIKPADEESRRGTDL